MRRCMNWSALALAGVSAVVLWRQKYFELASLDAAQRSRPALDSAYVVRCDLDGSLLLGWISAVLLFGGVGQGQGSRRSARRSFSPRYSCFWLTSSAPMSGSSDPRFPSLSVEDAKAVIALDMSDPGEGGARGQRVARDVVGHLHAVMEVAVQMQSLSAEWQDIAEPSHPFESFPPAHDPAALVQRIHVGKVTLLDRDRFETAGDDPGLAKLVCELSASLPRNRSAGTVPSGLRGSRPRARFRSSCRAGANSS